MCASIALSKKFTWCLSCPSDTYSSSFLSLATVRYYFTDAWHAESLVCDKKIYSHTQKQRFSDDRSDLRSELPREKNKKSGPKKSMKPRTAAILGSANTLKFRSESQIWVKKFSESADLLAYSPPSWSVIGNWGLKWHIIGPWAMGFLDSTKALSCESVHWTETSLLVNSLKALTTSLKYGQNPAREFSIRHT